ncbi:MAG: cbb3-type cytochrome oxidase subunit 3 [Alphaproteobacteria bacterium]|jgi:cbb3-type cytochrome oxidase subunit 3
MLYLKIGTLVILFIASILLLIWVFRPGSKKEYDRVSRLPLEDDDMKDVSPKKKEDKKKDR